MSSLSRAQQILFEVYVAYCQKAPVGRIDLHKLRKFFRECEAISASIPKLGHDVVEGIFDRSLTDGTTKLYFEDFEKAVIMSSMLYFSRAHAACAYTSLVDQVVTFLPSLKGPHFPESNLDKLADVADAVLEKSHACTFRPPSEYCSQCTWPEERSRTPAHSTNSKSQLSQPVFLSSSPVAPTDVSVSPTRTAAHEDRFSVPTLSGDPERAISHRTILVGPEVSEDLAEARDPHSWACQFQEVLLRHFGSLDIAFDFLDMATGSASGRITATKFRYSWQALGLRGDPRLVFSYMDVNGDGIIDAEEFKSWRKTREHRRSPVISSSYLYACSRYCIGSFA